MAKIQCTRQFTLSALSALSMSSRFSHLSKKIIKQNKNSDSIFSSVCLCLSDALRESELNIFRFGIIGRTKNQTFVDVTFGSFVMKIFFLTVLWHFTNKTMTWLILTSSYIINSTMLHFNGKKEEITFYFFMVKDMWTVLYFCLSLFYLVWSGSSEVICTNTLWYFTQQCSYIFVGSVCIYSFTFDTVRSFSKRNDDSNRDRGIRMYVHCDQQMEQMLQQFQR